MIPKVIHYCWFGGKPIPNDVKKCINSWKKKCPDYEIKCWNESNFDVNAHPFTKAAYEAKAWAKYNWVLRPVHSYVMAYILQIRRNTNENL